MWLCIRNDASWNARECNKNRNKVIAERITLNKFYSRVCGPGFKIKK